MRPVNLAKYTYPVILLLLVVISYIPSLDAPFVFDDIDNIVLNLKVHAEKITDLGRALNSEVSSSRPLAMFSFAVNHWLGGLNIFGYHLVNILIHSLNALLLYQLLLLIPVPRLPATTVVSADQFRKTAFWAAALWAVNPVQTQAVTYIVQRMTSMATFFYLATLCLYLAWRSERLATRPAIPLLLGTFALGLACKEIVLTLPLALILLDYIFFPQNLQRRLPFLAGGVLLSLFLALYYLQGHAFAPLTTFPNRNFNAWERIMTQWRVIWHYLSLFILPIPDRLHLTYNFTVSRSLFSPWTTIPALAAIITSITSAILLRHRFPVLAWAILFFFLTMLPEASFINLELAFIHRLYLPSLFLVFAALYYLPAATSKKAGPALLLLIALWSYWTITRNDEWQNKGRLWRTNIERGETTARAENNLATALIDGGRFTEALARIEAGLKIVELAADRLILNYNKAFTLFYLQDYPKALEVFQDIAREYGSYRQTYLYIGLIYLAQGKIELATDLATNLQKVESLRYQGDILRARILSREKHLGQASSLLTETLARESNSASEVRQLVQMALAKIFLRENRLREAYGLLLAMTEEFPQNYEVWKIIYLMQTAAGEQQRAAKIRDFLAARGIPVETAAPFNEEPGTVQ